MSRSLELQRTHITSLEIQVNYLSPNYCKIEELLQLKCIYSNYPLIEMTQMVVINIMAPLIETTGRSNAIKEIVKNPIKNYEPPRSLRTRCNVLSF